MTLTNIVAKVESSKRQVSLRKGVVSIVFPDFDSSPFRPQTPDGPHIIHASYSYSKNESLHGEKGESGSEMF